VICGRYLGWLVMGVHHQRAVRGPWLGGLRRVPGVLPAVWLIGLCVVGVVVFTVVADTVGFTAPAVEQTAAAQVVSHDPTSTPQAKVFLAETYLQGVGPDVLDAHAAVFVATAVCDQHDRRVGLATLSVNVQGMFPRLTPIQAHTLVDDAVKYYCEKW